MTASRKFPPTVEIKRVIAAAERAGIEIASVEIQPSRIKIHAKDQSDDRTPAEIAYDLWKLSEGQATSRIRRTAGKTDALPKKAKSSE